MLRTRRDAPRVELPATTSTGRPEAVIHYEPESEQVRLKPGGEIACSPEKLGELRFRLA